ncbi:MAG: hypothetical protein ACOYBP_03290 [Microbacteriaceae bacterium]
MTSSNTVIHEPWIPSKRELRARKNVFIQAWRFVRMSTIMFLLGHREHND